MKYLGQTSHPLTLATGLIVKRKEFLTEFLGALGAPEIKWKEVSDSFVSGLVIYDVCDPEEVQGFVWHKAEVDVPSDSVLRLAKLVNRQKLLNSDKLIIGRTELRNRFNAVYGVAVSEAEFTTIIDSLEAVRVPMLDEGKETDFYFIHE